MNEYFPKKDKNINSWSEIITTQEYIGRRITAMAVDDSVKKRILNDDTSAKIINAREDVCTNYCTSEFIITYTYAKKQEVVFGKYYSGPYDCSGFQYAIRISNELSEKDAITKINDFVKTQISLCGKFDPLTTK